MLNTIIGPIFFAIFMTSCAALVLTAIKSSSLTKYAIIALSGTTMIAHGSRMITQTLLYPTSYYKPGLFDLFFDWFTLLLLGIFVSWYGFQQFNITISKKTNQKNG